MKKEELQSYNPVEMLNESMAIALSRMILRKTDGSERRFAFDSKPSILDISKKVEINLEGMCFDGVINTAYELIRLYKESINHIVIVNSNLGKGTYLENAEFTAHSVLVIQFKNSHWFAVSPANYKIMNKINFEIIQANNLNELLTMIAQKSGGKWPTSEAILTSKTKAEATLETRKESHLPFIDEVSKLQIPVVQQNEDDIRIENPQILVYLRRIYSSGESFVELYKNFFMSYS